MGDSADGSKGTMGRQAEELCANEGREGHDFLCVLICVGPKVGSGARPGPPLKEPRRAVILVEEMWHGNAEFRPAFSEVVTELEWLLCETMDADEREAMNEEARRDAELIKGEFDDDESESFDRRKRVELNQRAREAAVAFVQAGGRRPRFENILSGLDIKAAEALGKGDAGLFEARGQFRSARLDNEFLVMLNNEELASQIKTRWMELDIKRLKRCNEILFLGKDNKELSGAELVDQICE